MPMMNVSSNRGISVDDREAMRLRRDERRHVDLRTKVGSFVIPIATFAESRSGEVEERMCPDNKHIICNRWMYVASVAFNTLSAFFTESNNSRAW